MITAEEARRLTSLARQQKANKAYVDQFEMGETSAQCNAVEVLEIPDQQDVW